MLLCNGRKLAVIILALLASIKANEYDYENTLLKGDDTRDNDNNKCIARTQYLEHEVSEERGMIMKESQTSFIPPYCEKRRHEDSHDDESLKRIKRMSEAIKEDLNFLHLDSMHSFSPEQVRSAQARTMKRYMDPTVNPCHDFYSYACGNWAKYNSIPSDKVAFDTFEILRESLDVALHNLLINDKDEKKQNNKKGKRNKRSSNKTRKQEKNAELKAKNLFRSCMNYEQIEKRGIEPLKELLDSLGGWPLLSPNWDEKKFDWLELVANLRRFNNDILIMQYVGPDINNSNKNVIQFDQTTLGLPNREYFLNEVNEKYLNSYRHFMTKIINLLGVEQLEASDLADEIIEFETQLAEIMISQEDRTNISVLYQKMTLAELQKEIPGIDWIRYLTIVQDRVVNSNEKVIMFANDYMKQLVKLIDQTEPAIVANYLLWRFVRHRINNLDNRFLEAKQTFYQECFGREKSPPRWKQCVAQVNSNMGMAVGALFVRRYFDENSKLDTLTMVRELQRSFREILNDDIDWIDDETKKLAEEKLNSMSLKIGYPDFILSRHKLDEKFATLHIHPDKYFENTLNVLKYLNNEEQKKVTMAVNKTHWQTYPAIVNAFYSRSKNQIMFPAGILQPPFYHRHFSKSLNYGGIGVVIGHETTHGFDDKGRLFDKDGNLNKWWSNYSIRKFHERTKCLINQFNQYTLTDIGQSINGESTQGENIADGGGINQSFRAYKRWLKSQPKEVLENETLPELNLTSTQLFFLNFGQVWCGDIRTEAHKNKMKIAVHSPSRFRVLGTLSNFEEFSKEFNCPKGSPMNPEKKCKVW
ncbi:hypothetical protein PVAND_004837 [Polypedilum vanderplanki]|uniref:Uncharacterized protein n=1 Tax=Polypedilum vanderplanki TaxID=319348 RepID=A0A9J6BYD1_POLVA|nr:hypothetical protein PVAND_004837 [Polypedilum vanderplanki]